MAEGSALSTEVRSSAKTPEAKKLQKKRVHKREVKGFYYHAAEYQRQKQGERKNVVNKMLHGFMAPFSIHVQAWRLRHFANKYGGRMQGWVLDNDIAQKALDKSFTEKDIRAFKAKTQMHTVFEKYEITKTDEAMAKSVLQNIFDKKGELTKEDTQRLQQESGLDESDIIRLATTAKENAGNGYLTVDEMKGKFADDAIFGGLTEDQVKIARRLCRDAWASTGFAALKYGYLGAMVVNPLFLGVGVAGALAGGAVSMGSSIGMRVASLHKEGATYAMNKLRGVAQQQHTGWFNRIMGVDWDKDHTGFQVARAALVGTGIGLIFKFHPQIMDGLGDLVHHGIPDHIPHVAPVPVNHELGKHALEGGLGPKTFHEHLSGYEQSVKQVYLPDTAHHDWQQLHTFVQHQKLPDGHTVNELKLSYNGVDDGVAHGKHYIDLMMPNGKQVFVQNDAVLAVNGPDADKLIKVFGLVNEHGHQSFQQIGEVHSINLAHQLGLNQGRIDNFAKLTQEAHGHLWHGTQDASDLQTILHDRGLYNNGNNGNYLYGVRIGGGYYDSAHHVFRIGASNHYYNHHLLTDNLAKEYHVPVVHAEPEQFHSVAARPLSWIDQQEDRGIDWLFSPHVAHALDNFTDFGLNNTDADALAVQHMWEERPWLAPILLTPYVGAGVGAYYIGQARSQRNRTRAGTLGLAAIETGLLFALPGMAVLAGGGYLLGRLRGRKKKEKTPKPANTQTNPETRPANTGSPSDTGGGAAVPASAATVTPTQPINQPAPTGVVESATQAQPAAPTTPTEPLEATIAGNEAAGLPSAPPPPPTATEPTPENLPATAAGEEEAPLAPPAPPANEGAVEATVPLSPTGAVETPEAVESTQQLDEIAPLTEDTYIQELNSLQKQTAQQLGLPQEQEQDLFHRLDDALRNGTYITVGRHITKFANPDSLTKFVANDFGFTTPEQTGVIQEYIREFETLHDRVAYSSAKRFAGEKVEGFSREDYENIRSQATVENIKQLYARLKENPADESLNKKLDEAIALAMQIGVPYMWQGVLPWHDIFQTDFTSSVSFGWVNYGEGPTSAEVNATDDALLAQLRDAQIPLGDKSTLEVYEGLEPAQRNELVAKAAQVVATQYKQFLEAHDQTVEGASAMIAHLIKANIIKGQDMKQYPLPQRPFFMLD